MTKRGLAAEDIDQPDDDGSTPLHAVCGVKRYLSSKHASACERVGSARRDRASADSEDSAVA